MDDKIGQYISAGLLSESEINNYTHFIICIFEKQNGSIAGIVKFIALKDYIKVKQLF